MNKSYDNFIKLAMKEKVSEPQDFLRLKKTISKKIQLPIPTNADLREAYEKMIAKGTIKRNADFEKILLSKKVRTESGVAVVAVLTKPYPCPGKCIYCPTEKEMPKSYLSNEPAVMRAIDAKFNPYKQVQNRLRALELNGHAIDKIELIVMGGTFSYLPKAYQKKFITRCFKACNDYKKLKVHKVRKFIKNKLEYEHKRNEKAKYRIVGLTLETRPDYVDAEEILNFRNLGCTRVELGVQSIFDEVLELNRRGHDIRQTIEATKLLKDAGFKINYHIMPGLPGSSIRKDLKMFEKLFSNPDFQPDMLKIYPTVIVKNSALYNIWKKGESLPRSDFRRKSTSGYKPLTDKAFEKFVLEIKEKFIPPYVRIARLVRDVPTSSIMAGPVVSNLRQIIAYKSACRCIRCREVRSDYQNKEKIILDRINYDASGGKEIFLQYVSRDKSKLYALLRLRIPDEKENFIPTLNNSAIIREVHTYGKMAQIRQKSVNSPQHIGLGKRLIQEAEKITKKEFGAKKIAVISGVGVRNYYRKLGYKLQYTYMVRNLE